MPHEPKLEIYKLKLLRKEDGRLMTFRELFRKKFNEYPIKNYPDLIRPIEVNDILKIYFDDFVKNIDLEGYNQNKRKKKAFTIATETVEGQKKSHISFNQTQMKISGVLQGGKYGIKRILGEVDNKAIGTDIETKHLVGDKFYFLLYTPIEETSALLMIQGYTESRISDVFLEHLKKYFKHLRHNDCQIELYIPEALRKEYLNGATFKSLIFSSGWNITANFNNEIAEREYEFQVKIEIVDKSIKKSNYKSAMKFLSQVGVSTFRLLNGRAQELSEFSNKNAKMESHGKEFPINFDDDGDIRPVILLANEGIEVGEGLIPNFIQVETYCNELLERLINEINPSNAVGRL